MLTHGEWLSLAAGIGASGVCLVVVAGVGAAMSSWRDALGVTRPETVSGELDRRLADKDRDDAILDAWWSSQAAGMAAARPASEPIRSMMGGLQQARPTLREALEALPDGAPIQIATERQFRLIVGDFCPDTTAERAKAALEAAKVAVPEPDVYAWFDPEKGRGRG